MGGVVFVVITLLALAATAVFTGSPNIQMAAGAATLTASFLLFWAWLNVSMTAVGMSKVPPLGKILAVPRNLPAHRRTTADSGNVRKKVPHPNPAAGHR